MSLSDEPLLRLRALGKSFPGGIQAVSGVDINVRRGEFLTLLGPSGCGKSTILRLIAGLASPSEGDIIWSDAMRPEIDFVFQDPAALRQAMQASAA